MIASDGEHAPATEKVEILRIVLVVQILPNRAGALKPIVLSTSTISSRWLGQRSALNLLSDDLLDFKHFAAQFGTAADALTYRLATSILTDRENKAVRMKAPRPRHFQHTSCRLRSRMPRKHDFRSVLP